MATHTFSEKEKREAELFIDLADPILYRVIPGRVQEMITECQKTYRWDLAVQEIKKIGAKVLIQTYGKSESDFTHNQILLIGEAFCRYGERWGMLIANPELQESTMGNYLCFLAQVGISDDTYQKASRAITAALQRKAG